MTRALASGLAGLLLLLAAALPSRAAEEPPAAPLGDPPAAAPARAAAEEAYAEAERAAAEKRFEEAEGILRGLVEEDPGNLRAGFLLARVLYWQGKRTDALDEYDRLLSLQPRNSDFMVGKAFALWFEGRLEEARALLEEALALAPRYEDAHRLYARVLEQLGDRRALAAHRAAVAARFPGRGAEVLRGPVSPGAEGEAPRRGEVEAGWRWDGLDGGRDSWTEKYVEALFRTGSHLGPDPLANRRLAMLRVRETDRFGRRDYGFQSSVSAPLDRSWTATVRGEMNPSHDILPRWKAGAEVVRDLGRGWIAHAGAARAEFGASAVATGTVAAEKYLGDWRAAYTVSRSHLLGDGNALSHRVQLERYYGHGGESRVGVGAARGEEIESTGAGVLRTRVQSYFVYGRHWLSDRWALTWEAGIHQQGDLYTRRGFLLGLRYRF